ncbi:pedicted SAM-dependent methyltransferase [Methanocella arvoryzae MRE50]|uniref:Pedicted SAM-dependent methyltransferase n=2 Tax=Methanocella TaxID=570266 RepID=Q0W826_METAR|nr:pedicted SAM-dependent methyltransferase [Methanocella arvoryzae MRE50]
MMRTEKRDFNKAAAKWDEEPRRVKLAGDVARAISEEVRLTPDMDVLDFGCGTGLLSLNLLPSVRSVTGVDSAQGMLSVLNSKIEALDLSNVRTMHIDIDKGDRLEGSYNLVTSSMTLHHVKDIKPLLDRFYRILVPAGYLCIADLDLDGGRFHEDSTGVFHNGFDRKELRQLLVDAGFEDVRDRTAASMTKQVAGGEKGEFTIFLVVGRKG